MDRHGIIGQGLGAELISDRWGFSRSDLDGLAVRSHALAHAATEAGAFAREIVPVATADGPVVRDQGIRPGTDLETLGRLRPAFAPEGRITAGKRVADLRRGGRGAADGARDGRRARPSAAGPDRRPDLGRL